MSYQALSVLVSNHFGVLTRVTNLFSRRGFNIKALTVGETENPELSRITILTNGDSNTLEQIIKQLSKLEDVKKVVALTNRGCINRELLLIKMKKEWEKDEAFGRILSKYAGNILNYDEESLIIEVTNDTKSIDHFIDQMRPYGILELCRTGVTALETGRKTIYNS